MISLIPLGMGYGGFLANIIQFGVDQLLDAYSNEIKAFISWYSWTCVSSQLTGSLTLYIYVIPNLVQLPSSIQYNLTLQSSSCLTIPLY